MSYAKYKNPANQRESKSVEFVVEVVPSLYIASVACMEGFEKK